MPNYFEILNIAMTANDEDVRQAYYSAAKKWHPDTGTASATDNKQFRKAHEAYVFLKTRPQRQAYIRHLQKQQRTRQAQQVVRVLTPQQQTILMIAGLFAPLFMLCGAIKEILWPLAPKQEA